MQYVSDGVGLQVPRHPNIIKSATGATGTVTIWTPTSGKRFRLLKYCIEVTGDAYAASAGIATISLLDLAAATGLIHKVALPGTAPTVPGPGYSTGWVDLGGIGLLSSAVGNTLRLVTSLAMTAGAWNIRLMGTEE